MQRKNATKNGQAVFICGCRVWCLSAGDRETVKFFQMLTTISAGNYHNRASLNMAID